MSLKAFQLLILFFILICITGTTSADVIQPGEKLIPYKYQLTNLQDYPDYIFILHGQPNPSLELLNSSEFNFYKFSTCSIYAIPKSIFIQMQIEKMNDTQLESFLENDSRVARSDLKLQGLYGRVKSADPLDNALVLLQINSLQGKDLDVTKIKIIYGYSDGQQVEKPFKNQSQTPEPTPPGKSWQYYLYFLALPILALAAIIFILMRKRLQ